MDVFTAVPQRYPDGPAVRLDFVNIHIQKRLHLPKNHKFIAGG